jgi:tetratricopeptide (TPR) repeat protein
MRLLQAIRAWDQSSRFAFFIALLLLAIALILAILGPDSVTQPALIGVGGLVIVIQIIMMWGNRGMVTAYTRAQRAYLAGEFDTARLLLEAERMAGRADFRDLTLLGNTYRQLSELTLSEQVLTEALRIRPNHHFPLYGFGRTLLVQGRYAEAVEVFARALDAGAPPVINNDLADAFYRQGTWQDARQALAGLDSSTEEPHRRLMIDYILYRLDDGGPPSHALVEAGLSYWRAEAERYAHTVYGQALARDVRYMQTLGGGRADV